MIRMKNIFCLNSKRNFLIFLNIYQYIIDNYFYININLISNSNMTNLSNNHINNYINYLFINQIYHIIWNLEPNDHIFNENLRCIKTKYYNLLIFYKESINIKY
jgi:hypothetical protein